MDVSKASNFCAMCARGEGNDMMLLDIASGTSATGPVALTLTSPGFDEKFTTAIVLGNCIHFTWTMGQRDGPRRGRSVLEFVLSSVRGAVCWSLEEKGERERESWRCCLPLVSRWLWCRGKGKTED